MSELHLLDILAAQQECYISDLKFSPLMRTAAILDLSRMEENKFPLAQWQDSAQYLTGIQKNFASVDEIKTFLRSELKS
jgi:hypothetical protein